MLAIKKVCCVPNIREKDFNLIKCFIGWREKIKKRDLPQTFIENFMKFNNNNRKKNRELVVPKSKHWKIFYLLLFWFWITVGSKLLITSKISSCWTLAAAFFCWLFSFLESTHTNKMVQIALAANRWIFFYSLKS